MQYMQQQCQKKPLSKHFKSRSLLYVVTKFNFIVLMFYGGQYGGQK